MHIKVMVRKEGRPAVFEAIHNVANDSFNATDEFIMFKIRNKTANAEHCERNDILGNTG
jgi:hypothetical protein